jgi:hypothetical protein
MKGLEPARTRRETRGASVKVEAQIISESAISDSRTSVHQIHLPATNGL